MADPRFDIDYKAGGTPAQQINSLGTEARLRGRFGSRISSFCARSRAATAPGPGPIDYPMTKFEYCTLDGLHLDAA
eukprot:6607785-Prymnesium_polylepis.1